MLFLSAHSVVNFQTELLFPERVAANGARAFCGATREMERGKNAVCVYSVSTQPFSDGSFLSIVVGVYGRSVPLGGAFFYD